MLILSLPVFAQFLKKFGPWVVSENRCPIKETAVVFARRRELM